MSDPQSPALTRRRNPSKSSPTFPRGLRAWMRRNPVFARSTDMPASSITWAIRSRSSCRILQLRGNLFPSLVCAPAAAGRTRELAEALSGEPGPAARSPLFH